MIETIEGNILNIIVPGQILAHQVNCQQVAGAGLAKQIRDKYPEWYTSFFRFYGKLSDVNYTLMSDGIIIADLYAQEYFGKDKQYTDYDALADCFSKLSLQAKHYTILLPYGIGCGLGGGNWETVYSLIELYLPNSILVRLYNARRF